MIGILGKKLGMTNVYDEAGKVVPVTLIEAGPCHVIQVKTKEADGYAAIQVGFGSRRDKLVSSPEKGKFKKAGVTPPRFVKEIRVVDATAYKTGQTIEADVFAKGDYVDVTGTSIGRGFQGGVKRWGGQRNVRNQS